MNNYFLITSLIGWIIIFAQIFRLPIEIAPLISFASFICILYIAGLIGHLPIGYIVLYVIGCCGILYSFYSFLKRKPSSWSIYTGIFTPGIFIFLAALMLLWIYCKNIVYTGWDEFSHWGLTIKEIFIRNALPSLDSCVKFKDYPPGVALFDVFIAKGINNIYSESNIIFAHSLLLIAPILSLLQRLRWKEFLLALCIALYGYIIILTLGGFYIYVDTILALFLGGAIAIYFSLGGGTKAALTVTPIIFALPSIKSTGTMLAYVLSLVISIDNLLLLKCQQKRLATSAVIILICFASGLSHSMWQHRIAEMGFVRTFNTQKPLEDAINIAMGSNIFEKDHIIISNFKKALTHDSLLEGIPSIFTTTRLACFIFLVLSVVIITGIDGISRARLLSLSICIALYMAIYSFGLLLLYLRAFSPYEGERLASFARYMDICIFGSLFALFSLTIKGMRIDLRKRHAFTITFLLMVALGMEMVITKYNLKLVLSNYLHHNIPLTIIAPLAIFSLALPQVFNIFQKRSALCVLVLSFSLSYFGIVHYMPILKDKKQDSNILSQRAAMRNIANFVSQKTKDTDKIYYILQNTTGRDFRILSYELAPRPFNDWCWSIGAPYSPNDVWTCKDQTPENLIKSLAKYDYVVLGKIDNSFIDTYKDIFINLKEGSKEILYKVNHDGSNTITPVN